MKNFNNFDNVLLGVAKNDEGTLFLVSGNFASNPMYDKYFTASFQIDEIKEYLTDEDLETIDDDYEQYPLIDGNRSYTVSELKELINNFESEINC